MFAKVAELLDTDLTHETLFMPEQMGEAGHEEERLICIGPFSGSGGNNERRGVERHGEQRTDK
jgi:hypothetical protein